MESLSLVRIDIWKLVRYILKWVWIPVLCFLIGFGGMYYRTAYMQPDTYTAEATMYIYNGNPNVVNYQYTSSGDLDSAVKLLDTYMVVIKSNKVMSAVAERLNGGYQPEYLAATISMGSVDNTGVMRVMSTTNDPQLSADICNAVVDIAPQEIIRVVSAGSVEVIDYAEVPAGPNGRGAVRKGILGGMALAVLALGVLFVLFLLNRKVTVVKDLTDSFTPPILAMVPYRRKKPSEEDYLITDKTPARIAESYGQLRMNLTYTLPEGENIVLISSSVPGEGKSTISSNLAISLTRDGKRVLLVDADMRRPTLGRKFGITNPSVGLSGLLSGKETLEAVIHKDVRPGLDLIPGGNVSTMPAELLNSGLMRQFLREAARIYDYVLLDMPPINLVSDPLVLSDAVGGMVMVARQHYSNLREIAQALNASELTGIKVLGMVYYGSSRADSRYGSRYYNRYYDSYYSQYDGAKSRKSRKIRKD